MNLNLVIRAAKFSREAHESIGQRRKYTGEPYFVHPEQVALLLSEYTDDPELIAAAYLHDTVEDVNFGPRPVTFQIIAAEFNDRVASYVKDLTNIATPADGNRATRKAIERDRLAKICGGSKMAKMCDIIHNVPSVVEYDRDFAPVFLAEKAAILQLFSETEDVLVTGVGIDNILSPFCRLLRRATNLVNELLEQVDSKT